MGRVKLIFPQIGCDQYKCIGILQNSVSCINKMHDNVLTLVSVRSQTLIFYYVGMYYVLISYS